MDALPRDSPQDPDHEWVNETRSKMDIITCHKVNSPSMCRDSEGSHRKITRSLGCLMFYRAGSRANGKAYDWIGSGG